MRKSKKWAALKTRGWVNVLARLLLNRGFDLRRVQFQIVGRGRNSASGNCCAINWLICFEWHSVD